MLVPCRKHVTSLWKIGVDGENWSLPNYVCCVVKAALVCVWLCSEQIWTNEWKLLWTNEWKLLFIAGTLTSTPTCSTMLSRVGTTATPTFGTSGDPSGPSCPSTTTPIGEQLPQKGCGCLLAPYLLPVCLGTISIWASVTHAQQEWTSNS